MVLAMSLADRTRAAARDIKSSPDARCHLLTMESEHELETSFDPTAILERLPSEHTVRRASAPELSLLLLVRSAMIALLGVLTAPVWPFYLLGRAIWGRPPNVPRAHQILRYLRLAWMGQQPAPGLSFLARLWLTLSILRKFVVIPIWGLAWILDQALYGRLLRETPVQGPLLEISALRSGSTQLARYLEEDPRLVAPNFLQSVFPYLWLWRLVPKTVGRFVTRQRVREATEALLPKAFLQRHETDPLRTDTFDIAFYLAHLNHLSPLLGPGPATDDFGFAMIAPHNQLLWKRDFVEVVDGIARKTLLHAGPTSDGAPRRFFLKGHFLCAAETLKARYPDARFLTMIREPAPRLRSTVNYLRTNPFDPILGPVPWAWLSEGLLRSEVRYCEVEQDWFTRSDDARRCVLRFSEYVADLDGSLARVYRDCLDLEMPANRPTSHTKRNRTNYLVDRSLADLGVDESALNTRLAAYIEWCRAS